MKRAGRPEGRLVRVVPRTKGSLVRGLRPLRNQQPWCEAAWNLGCWLRGTPLYRRRCYLKSTKHLASLSPHTIPWGFLGWSLASHGLSQAGLVSTHIPFFQLQLGLGGGRGEGGLALRPLQTKTGPPGPCQCCPAVPADSSQLTRAMLTPF